MRLRIGSLAFVLLMVILSSNVVSGQTQGMAIIAHNYGLQVPGVPAVSTGHLAFAYQDPLDGLFVFGSVGLDLSKASNVIDSKDLDINKKYTFDELKTLLAQKGYDSYKAFYVDKPQVNEAIDAENALTTANYNLFASITKPYTDPFSHAVNADDENCLTAAIKVLRAYGVKDLPDTNILTITPNAYYLTTPAKTYYPDFMGDDPVVPTSYQKPTEEAAVAGATLGGNAASVAQGSDNSPIANTQGTIPAAVSAVGSQQNSQPTIQTGQAVKANNFPIGAKVETTNALNVRNAPGTSSSTIISTKTTGSTGTILSGPVSADGFTWYKIGYADGTTGWSEDKRLESASVGQQPAVQTASQSIGTTPKVISADKPTYYPPGATSNGNGPVQLGYLANNQQVAVDKQPVTQPIDRQLATQPSESAFGDNQPTIDQQPVTQPVDQQPITSKYTSQIPSGDAQVIQGTSSVAPILGQVQLDLDLRNENGNAVPKATEVTVKDGSGNYVQVNWDSNGHALANGAPGTWTIIADAPGYSTNINNVDVSSSSSSTSSKMYLQKAGFNNQAAPIISAPANPLATQPVVQQPTSSVANVPLELDIRNENGNPVPADTKVTVQDGSGNIVQVNWDSNGHALAYGAPGNWKITADAPGYSTNTGYTPVSSASSSTSFRMNLQRGGYNQPAPVNLPPVNQPTSQPVDQQPSLPANNQPASQLQNGGLSQEQKDDILINQLKSGTQGKDLSESEANDLMDQLDEHQKQLDQQPTTQSSESAFGENQQTVAQQPVLSNSSPG